MIFMKIDSDSDALLVGVNGFLQVISPIFFAVVGETRCRISRSNYVLSLCNLREVRFMERQTLLTDVNKTLPDCIISTALDKIWYSKLRSGKMHPSTGTEALYRPYGP